MNRRKLIALLASTAAVSWARVVRAQQAQKVFRIGFLGNSTAALEANLVEPFRQGLRELGYVEDQNVIIEYRWAEGKYDRFPALIAELVGLNVDVIVTAGTPSALAVKQSAPSTPLVMIAVGDPVGSGLIESLARPGGNATGLTSIAPELEGKRLELLREVLPSVSTVAVLWNPANAYMATSEKEVHVAAQALRIKVLSLPVRTLEELDAAFGLINREHPDALNVTADRLFLHNRARIVEFALSHSLPGVHAYRELVVSGGLMSYGPNYADMHKRAAMYLDRIFKGTKPADLPVQAPTTFEMIVNIKTAKTLGLTLPPTLLARADEVIE
jgi:putative tryptophan/tyrosine transport system substrate-binding protein